MLAIIIYYCAVRTNDSCQDFGDYTRNILVKSVKMLWSKTYNFCLLLGLIIFALQCIVKILFQLANTKESKLLLYHGGVAEMDKVKSRSDSKDALSIQRTFLRPDTEDSIVLNVGFSNLQDGNQTIREIRVARAEVRVFSLPCRSHPGDAWQLAVDVTSEYGRHLVTLRSPIHVRTAHGLPEV